MAASDIIKGTVWEDASATCMGRLTTPTGANATQSSVSTITYGVYDLDGTQPLIAVTSGTAATTATLYNALQTDARWTEDATGYNFAYTVTPTSLANGEHQYRVVFTFTFTTAEVAKALYDLSVKGELRR